MAFDALYQDRRDLTVRLLRDRRARLGSELVFRCGGSRRTAWRRGSRWSSAGTRATLPRTRRARSGRGTALVNSPARFRCSSCFIDPGLQSARPTTELQDAGRANPAPLRLMSLAGGLRYSTRDERQDVRHHRRTAVRHGSRPFPRRLPVSPGQDVPPGQNAMSGPAGPRARPPARGTAQIEYNWKVGRWGPACLWRRRHGSHRDHRSGTRSRRMRGNEGRRDPAAAAGADGDVRAVGRRVVLPVGADRRLLPGGRRDRRRAPTKRRPR
jgi:hypothetical protein